MKKQLFFLVAFVNLIAINAKAQNLYFGSASSLTLNQINKTLSPVNMEVVSNPAYPAITDPFQVKIGLKNSLGVIFWVKTFNVQLDNSNFFQALGGTYAIPANVPTGAYYVYAEIDPDQVAAETDESDNIYEGSSLTSYIASATTGIKENEAYNDIKCFYNVNQLQITGTKKLKQPIINVYSVDGKQILFTNENSSNESIAINFNTSLHSGMYIVTIYFDNKKITQKFVVD